MSNKVIEDVNRNLEVVNSELPSLITTQVDKIKSLEKKIQNSIKSARKAGKDAKTASNKSAKSVLFKDNKKEAIESLQTASNSVAKAVQSNAEAHKISFEFHEELAKISKYLLMLGVKNIADNHTVVRELEMKMKGASKHEISELAKQELLSVIRQLKKQENLQKKLESINSKLKEHYEDLKAISSNSNKLNDIVHDQTEADIRHERELSDLKVKREQTNKKLNVHDEQLKKISQSNHRLTKDVIIQERVNKQYMKELTKQAELVKCHDKKLENQAKKYNLHNQLINNIENQISVIQKHSFFYKFAFIFSLISLFLFIIFIIFTV